MNVFDKAFNIVIGSEGGYVNSPSDPGGETNFGICKRSYPRIDIKALTPDKAKQIYLTDYWIKAHCDELPWPLALYVFDCAVNQGPAVAIRLLQESVGVTVDGVFGPHTRAASVNADNQESARFMALRAVRYAGTANFDKFGRGWMRRLFATVMEAA